MSFLSVLRFCDRETNEFNEWGEIGQGGDGKRKQKSRFTAKAQGTQRKLGRAKYILKVQEQIQKIEAGGSLARADAEAVMLALLAGTVSEDDIVRLLAALRTKGETVDELVGFAMAIRRRCGESIALAQLDGATLVDTCGTGGDARGTFNISTAAAFVAAGAGARVAKHGNRSFSSQSGSADVLEALGVRVDRSIEDSAAAIHEVGIAFFFAPTAHSAARYAVPARKKLGGRTVFNLLGPLTNPAGAAAQVLGVFDSKWVEPMAHALAELGTRRAFVVHGADGLDEISLSGDTRVAEVREKFVTVRRVTPEDFGLERAPIESLAGGDAHVNAALITQILEGERGARRDIVLVNASAALVAAGRAADFREGVVLAASAIDRGAALEKLSALAKFSNR
jgi:anthranilate phosphoribosyltransferase